MEKFRFAALTRRPNVLDPVNIPSLPRWPAGLLSRISTPARYVSRAAVPFIITPSQGLPATSPPTQLNPATFVNWTLGLSVAPTFCKLVFDHTSDQCIL